MEEDVETVFFDIATFLIEINIAYLFQEMKSRIADVKIFIKTFDGKLIDIITIMSMAELASVHWRSIQLPLDSNKVVQSIAVSKMKCVELKWELRTT